MTREEAQKILRLYRPAVAQDDPEMQQAIYLARRDPELMCWLEQHCAAEGVIRAKFRGVEPPANLASRIISARRGRSMVPVTWAPARLAIAALIVVSLSLAVFWLRPPPPDRFADFSMRMVKTALREYRMDVLTDDMQKLRAFFSQAGAPADYQVPSSLQKLALTGGGLLRWRGHPVSMVCFNQGGNQMLFLFVMDRSAVSDGPPSAPERSKVNKLSTASWASGNRVYLLAGPEDPDFLKNIL